MVDHHINKFFEALFWIGALLVLASFFYPRWFVVTIIIGIIFMIIAVGREGLRLRKAKTLTGVIKKNKPKVIHRFILIIGVLIIFVSLIFKQTLIADFIAQLYDLIQSPATTTWWVFVLIGIIIGLFMLFSATKAGEVEYKKPLSWIKLKRPKFMLKKKPEKIKKKKAVAKKGIVKEKPSFFARIKQVFKRKKQKEEKLGIKKEEEMPIPISKKEAVAKKVTVAKIKPGFLARLLWEEESFWRRALRPLLTRLETRSAKRLKAKKTRMEQLRKKKIEALKRRAKKQKIILKEITAKHPLWPRLLVVLFIFAITTILVLHRKGKFSIENPISAGILGLIVGLFALYIVINIYKARKEKKIKEVKKEKVVLTRIKKEIVAKASKYETDIDKLYRLINEVGTLTITEVAEGFGISREQAEEWGRILESHDLIELNYPAMGELQLCKKKLKSIK